MRVSATRTIISGNGAMNSFGNGGRLAEYDRTQMSWNGNMFAPPPAQSVLYLPGHPGTGTTITDFSTTDAGVRNNYHGTITGATWSRLPSGQPVLDIDAVDDIIRCGTAAALLPNAFTFVTLFKAGAGRQIILSWGDDYPLIDFEPGTPQLATGGSNWRTWNNAPVNPLDGKYHLLAFSCPGVAQADINNAVCIIDGQTQTVNSTLATGAQTAKSRLDLGNRFTSANYTAKTMGLMSLFPNVLTLAQLTNMYQQLSWLWRV